jgi:hypothetical protein
MVVGGVGINIQAANVPALLFRTGALRRRRASCQLCMRWLAILHDSLSIS